jgi:hypothetical protein
LATIADATLVVLVVVLVAVVVDVVASKGLLEATRMQSRVRIARVPPLLGPRHWRSLELALQTEHIHGRSAPTDEERL